MAPPNETKNKTKRNKKNKSKMPHVEFPQADFKVVILGDTFTGKTSLVLRFAEGHYRDSARDPTVGAFFITKRLTVNVSPQQQSRHQPNSSTATGTKSDDDNINDSTTNANNTSAATHPVTAKLQIWDTAGQEQFKKLAPMYYKNAAAAIICYDVTSPTSFETLECKDRIWYQMIVVLVAAAVSAPASTSK